jgi:hypothetical protein
MEGLLTEPMSAADPIFAVQAVLREMDNPEDFKEALRIEISLCEQSLDGLRALAKAVNA